MYRELIPYLCIINCGVLGFKATNILNAPKHFTAKLIILLHLSFKISTNASKMGGTHRVSIEWKSPNKESYNVNSHRKSFDDVLSDYRACVRFQI